jgi:ABC-2 type transport system permease protein
MELRIRNLSKTYPNGTHALRDYFGEERLNGALREFLGRVRFQEPPYTTSLELYAHLRATTPDSLHGVLADMFEHVTLYDNRAREDFGEALYLAKHRITWGRQRIEVEVEGTPVRGDRPDAAADRPPHRR